jgi:hypothetical protein
MFVSTASLTRAVASHIASGLEFTTKAELDRRLAVCTGCSERKGTNCSRCGCGIHNKARIKAPQCSKWELPMVD